VIVVVLMYSPLRRLISHSVIVTIMKTPLDKQTAETRVVRKYQKLYVPLIELIDALQNLEPGGTLVDDVVLSRKDKGSVHMEYVARPTMLTIVDGKRTFILRVVEQLAK
jgi:hypothetical protein